MFRDDRIVCSGQLLESGANFFVARLSRAQTRVSESNARVPNQAPPFRAFYRAAAKCFAKFYFRERDQPFELRQKKRMLRHTAWLEVCECINRCVAIPGTDVLADIATKNM